MLSAQARQAHVDRLAAQLRHRQGPDMSTTSDRSVFIVRLRAQAYVAEPMKLLRAGRSRGSAGPASSALGWKDRAAARARIRRTTKKHPEP